MLLPHTPGAPPESEELPVFLEDVPEDAELPPILCVGRMPVRHGQGGADSEKPGTQTSTQVLRLSKPNETPVHGWVEVQTPLGALAHVVVNSASHEICDDWRMLTKGRVSLIEKTNFAVWFGALCAAAPAGLVAELLLANEMVHQFTALVAADPEVRAHLARLPEHCFDLDQEERDLLALAVDTARVVEVGDAARLAALEAAKDA
jgi:hypothetical protein